MSIYFKIATIKRIFEFSIGMNGSQIPFFRQKPAMMINLCVTGSHCRVAKIIIKFLLLIYSSLDKYIELNYQNYLDIFVIRGIECKFDFSIW